ncbi:MAG: PHP domain-containing protein [Acidaminococcaceae bacterium]|nr:PHP domain-containing protein [Acidaminococcaceae bacterium]
MTLRRVDLHLHTVASDGTWTPEEAVAAAQKAGLGIMAITDHDSVKSVAAAQKAAQAAGIAFHTGTEICSTYENHCFHILGYDIDIANKGLLEHLAYNEYLLLKKDEDSIMLLQEEGWPVSLEEYRAYQYDKKRGGFKSLIYLVDKGLCKDVKDFFARIFTKDKGLEFPIFPSIEDTINIIHTAGGKAFLAHSASDFHGPGLDATLHALGNKPFDGFECYHTGHSLEDTATLVRYCHEHHKLISGGSDCHGKFVDGRIIGKPVIYENEIRMG